MRISSTLILRLASADVAGGAFLRSVATAGAVFLGGTGILMVEAALAAPAGGTDILIVGELINHRPDHFTGAAPFGPEINKHRRGGLKYFGVEIIRS